MRKVLYIILFFFGFLLVRGISREILAVLLGSNFLKENNYVDILFSLLVTSLIAYAINRASRKRSKDQVTERLREESNKSEIEDRYTIDPNEEE